jgi:V8-like Glu-specific endopeptidase
MAWDENLTALNYVLANLYPLTRDSFRIVSAAGIPITHVAFQDKAIDNWFEILSVADKRDKVLEIVKAALKDYPDDPTLIQAEKGELTPDKGPVVDKDVNWKGDLSADTVEKLMGAQSTLLPITFLEVGLQRAHSVARVRLGNGTLGTGFLIDNNIFVTNHHVIQTVEQAKDAIIQFNYQKAATGLDLEPVSFHFDPDSGFKTSKADDWTLVRMKEDANADWGAIKIEQVDVTKTQWVNIIQHPSGGPKQIALYNNIVAYADEKRVQYLTDTLPGSSGSPVFDSQWRPVALHHSGGWIVEPGTKKHVFRNEGININLVLAGLTQNGL